MRQYCNRTDESRYSFIALLVIVLSSVLLLAGCSTKASTPDVQKPPSADGFQEKILEGGVTDAEYRLAIEAMRACIEEQGWSTGEPTIRTDGLTIDVPVQGKIQGPASQAEREADAAEAGKVRSECFVKYAMLVEREYKAEHQPTEAEQAAEKQKFIACLELAGLTGMLITDDFKALGEKAQQQLGTSGQQMAPFTTCVSAYPGVIPLVQGP